MKILILENGYRDLEKSRIPLGLFFQLKGHRVFYACPEPSQSEVHNIPMSRHRIYPLEIFNSCIKLKELEMNLSIEAVMSFRLIPNFLNYLASFTRSEIKRVAVITGLGYAFISSNNSLSARIQRILIKSFYQLASRRIQIITQNSDDLNELGVANGLVVLGSGEKAISEYNFDIRTDSIRLLYVGRLLKTKGIRLAIEIFLELRKRNLEATLTIAGIIDESNPDSISETELGQYRKIEGIKYLGYVNDVDQVYRCCNILLFPSTYREGVPRALIESLKNGLTIVTRNMPGCKETINKNGFLIQDSTTVKEVVEYLMSLNDKCILENRKRSIELFNTMFSAEVIYPQYLATLAANVN